jgi:hypothetical protein
MTESAPRPRLGGGAHDALSDWQQAARRAVARIAAMSRLRGSAAVSSTGPSRAGGARSLPALREPLPLTFERFGLDLRGARLWRPTSRDRGWRARGRSEGLGRAVAKNGNSRRRPAKATHRGGATGSPIRGARRGAARAPQPASGKITPDRRTLANDTGPRVRTDGSQSSSRRFRGPSAVPRGPLEVIDGDSKGSRDTLALIGA